MYLRPIANVIRKSTKMQGGSDTQNGHDDDSESGIPNWLWDALPSLSKGAKKDLKERGVDVRRSVKESDDKKERRRKGRNVIGTKSGYEKRLESNRRGMIEASKRRNLRKDGAIDNDEGAASEDEFGGFD